MVKNGMRPIHPGEILREEYMVPLGLSATALTHALGVTPARINDIIRERRGITAEKALRLARYFKMSPHFWLGLQMDYELDTAKDALEGRLEKEIKPMSAAG